MDLGPSSRTYPWPLRLHRDDIDGVTTIVESVCGSCEASVSGDGTPSSDWEGLVKSAKGARTVTGLVVADDVVSPTVRLEVGPSSTQIWIADAEDPLLVGLREQIMQQLRRSERRRSSAALISGLFLGSILSLVVLAASISVGSWAREESISSLWDPYAEGPALVRLAPVAGLGVLGLCWLGAWRAGRWAQRFRRDRVVLSWEREAAQRKKDRLIAAGIGVLTNVIVAAAFLLIR